MFCGFVLVMSSLPSYASTRCTYTTRPLPSPCSTQPHSFLLSLSVADRRGGIYEEALCWWWWWRQGNTGHTRYLHLKSIWSRQMLLESTLYFTSTIPSLGRLFYSLPWCSRLREMERTRPSGVITHPAAKTRVHPHVMGRLWSQEREKRYKIRERVIRQGRVKSWRTGLSFRERQKCFKSIGTSWNNY